MIHSSVLYFLNDLLCLTLHRYCFGVHSLNQFQWNVWNWWQNIVRRTVRYPTQISRQENNEKQAVLCSNAKCKCSNSLWWESTQLHSNEQTIKGGQNTPVKQKRNPMTDLAERVGRKEAIYKGKKNKTPFWCTRSTTSQTWFNQSNRFIFHCFIWWRQPPQPTAAHWCCSSCSLHLLQQQFAKHKQICTSIIHIWKALQFITNTM